MLKFITPLLVIGGALVAAVQPASALPAASKAVIAGSESTPLAQPVYYRHHHRGFGLGIGFGVPYFYSGPRYRYYDDYDYYPRRSYRSSYYYSQPYGYYGGYGRHRHHHRHW